MSSDNDGTTLRCSNGHNLDRGDLFCPVCGAPALGQSGAESAGEDSSESGETPSTGTGRKKVAAIGGAVVIAVAIVILIAAHSNGGNANHPNQVSSSRTTVYSASQECADNAKIWMAKAIGDMSAGLDPSQDFVGAATQYGTQSRTYQAMVDAYGKVSTMVFQEGAMTAARRAGSIIDSDCSNDGSSNGYSSASGQLSAGSSSAAIAGPTETTDTTTTHPYVPPPATTSTSMPRSALVPEVTYSNVSSATQALTQLGFTVSTVSAYEATNPQGTVIAYCSSDPKLPSGYYGRPSGEVISQNPEGNGWAVLGSNVQLGVCP